MQRDSSWPVRLSVTLMNLLGCVQILSSHLPVSLSSHFEWSRNTLQASDVFLVILQHVYHTTEVERNRATGEVKTKHLRKSKAGFVCFLFSLIKLTFSLYQ